MYNNSLLKPGDIFVTRNKNEDQNKTPGYWNHIAMYIGTGVVEGQSKPWNSIICSDTEEFQNRYYKFNVYRWNEDFGLKAATEARRLVGKPYGTLNSLWYTVFLGWHLGRKFNCVSTVRMCYKIAIGKDPGWVWPDALTEDKRLTLVMTKGENEK